MSHAWRAAVEKRVPTHKHVVFGIDEKQVHSLVEGSGTQTRVPALFRRFRVPAHIRTLSPRRGLLAAPLLAQFFFHGEKVVATLDGSETYPPGWSRSRFHSSVSLWTARRPRDIQFDRRRTLRIAFVGTEDTFPAVRDFIVRLFYFFRFVDCRVRVVNETSQPIDFVKSWDPQPAAAAAAPTPTAAAAVLGDTTSRDCACSVVGRIRAVSSVVIMHPTGSLEQGTRRTLPGTSIIFRAMRRVTPTTQE